MNKPLRLGMVGGGLDAFIGKVHRIAARMDGEYILVCGVFSSQFEKTKATALQLGISLSRVYETYEEMYAKEKLLSDDECMQVVSIVTTNHLHFLPSKLALENGYHVVLDKPMTFNLAEAIALERVLENSSQLLCLTHTYTGYPMIKQARAMIAINSFGAIRKVYVEYPQGWLSRDIENENQKQASWRTDPTKSGIAGAMGDIGTHAFNLAEYVTGLQVTALSAQINTVVANRKLDDDGAVLLTFNNGATGTLIATQVAAGAENNIKISVFGEKGGIEWQQENCNSLTVKWLDKPTQIYRAGNDYLEPIAKHNCRTPAGHPEGYLEAFANLYRNFALTIKAKAKGENPKAAYMDYPGIKEGVRGILFIEKVIESGQSQNKWIEL